MSKKSDMPSFFDAETKYDVTKEQLIEAVRAFTGFKDGIVEFDVSNKGQVRGATVRVKRLEIKG
jgi:hypothetical protein